MFNELDQSVASSRSMTINKKVGIIVSGQTDTVLRPCCAIRSTTTWQSSEIQVSILLGLTSHCVFLSCCLLVFLKSDCGLLSVDKSINTSTCFRGKVLVQKHLNQVFKSNECEGSGKSSTQDHPESLTMVYTVERKLACFAYLCHHPLDWLRCDLNQKI